VNVGLPNFSMVTSIPCRPVSATPVCLWDSRNDTLAGAGKADVTWLQRHVMGNVAHELATVEHHVAVLEDWRSSPYIRKSKDIAGRATDADHQLGLVVKFLCLFLGCGDDPSAGVERRIGTS
jgi:hypothetical protein